MLVVLLFSACSSETPAPEPTKMVGHRPVLPMNPEKPASQPVEDAPAAAERPNQAPLIKTIRLSPGAPTRMDTLKAEVVADDPEGQSVTLEYDWLVNGKEISRVRKPELVLGDFVRGDKVVLRVTATDYQDETVIDSDEVEIVNAAPVIATDPKKIKSLDGFAIQASDPDGDPLTWTAAGGPPSLTVDADGVLHWKGSADDEGGKFTVKVTVADAFEGKATLELPLDIAPGKPGRMPPAPGAKP